MPVPDQPQQEPDESGPELYSYGRLPDGKGFVVHRHLTPSTCSVVGLFYWEGYRLPNVVAGNQKDYWTVHAFSETRDAMCFHATIARNASGDPRFRPDTKMVLYFPKAFPDQDLGNRMRHETATW